MLRVCMRGYLCPASSSVCPGGRTFVFQVRLRMAESLLWPWTAPSFRRLSLLIPFALIPKYDSLRIGYGRMAKRRSTGRATPASTSSFPREGDAPASRATVLRTGRLGDPVRPVPVAVVPPQRPLTPRSARSGQGAGQMGFHAGRGASTGERPAFPLLLA